MGTMQTDASSLRAGSNWWELAGHEPASLRDAWRRVHHALQPAAELAKAFAIPESDDSHTAFEWVSGKVITDGYFRGSLIETPRGVVRSALRVFDMMLFLINPDGDIYAESPLEELSSEQAHAWVLNSAMNQFDIPVRQATEPAPDLPDHPVAGGAPFGAPSQLALIELVRLYANTHSLLSAIVSPEGKTPKTLCWPHHFDIARLFKLETSDEGEAVRTLGVGLAPPDSVSEHGYWYVSPWSADQLRAGGSTRPPLNHGRWHERDGQPPMAVLEINALSGIEDRDEQHHLVTDFLAVAINASA